MGAYQIPNTIYTKRPDQNEAEPWALSDVINWPMPWFKELEPYIVDGKRRTYKDALVMIAGTDLAVGTTVNLFTTGEGNQGLTFNTAAAFVKSRFHTNMFDDGKFQAGVSCIVTAFEFKFTAPPCKPAVAGTGNNVGIVTDASDHATQPTGYNPLAFTKALLSQNTWEFYRGPREIEYDGSLESIPASVGLTASFGAQTTSALVQNSQGPFSVQLEKPMLLHSQEKFFIKITSQSALKIPIDCIGWFRMRCVELQTGFTS